MRELLIDRPLFVGFKVSERLQEALSSLENEEREYVSAEGSTFLRFCDAADGLYVGKIVSGRLRTNQVEDIRRNVLSIIRRLGHEIGLPRNLVILACGLDDGHARSRTVA